MRKFLPLLVLIFASCISVALIGCGGSGGGGSDDSSPNNGGDDGSTQPPGPDPFSIDSYTEYTGGNDLSGIWMMVATSEYDASSDVDIHHATESFRSTVFIKENNSGSYSSLDVSNPFCAPWQPYTSVNYSGNNVLISVYNSSYYASTTNIDMTISDYGRMSGTLTNDASDCGIGDVCPNSISDTKIEMVKVAPLPIGNWYNNFQYATPKVGTVTGVVQSDATTDAFEFDTEIDCFAHSKGKGGQHFMASVFQAPTTEPDYESLIVSTKDGDNLFITKNNGQLTYANVRMPANNYPYGINVTFDQSTTHFNMIVTGLNPTKINVSADASNDASSDDPHADGAELDIHFNY